MKMDKKERIAYAELLNRCWEEPEYLVKFRKDPAAALEDFGLPTAPGARYHVVDADRIVPSTPEDIYLPFMPRPETVELNDQMLEAVACGKDTDTDNLGDFFYLNSNIAVNLNVAADTMTAVETSAVIMTWGVLFTI